MHSPLRAARIAQGKSIPQLAAAAGLDAGNLSRLERGLQGASPELAERLVKALGGAISELEILYPERFVRAESAQ